VILNIVPSLDTAVCATSTRKFNEAAGKLANTVVLVVSADLPFASKRFRTIEGLQNVVPLSLMRGKNFAEDYGVLIEDGPLAESPPAPWWSSMKTTGSSTANSCRRSGRSPTTTRRSPPSDSGEGPIVLGGTSQTLPPSG